MSNTTEYSVYQLKYIEDDAMRYALAINPYKNHIKNKICCITYNADKKRVDHIYIPTSSVVSSKRHTTFTVDSSVLSNIGATMTYIDGYGYAHNGIVLGYTDSNTSLVYIEYLNIATGRTVINTVQTSRVHIRKKARNLFERTEQMQI